MRTCRLTVTYLPGEDTSSQITIRLFIQVSHAPHLLSMDLDELGATQDMVLDAFAQARRCAGGEKVPRLAFTVSHDAYLGMGKWKG